MKISIITVVYNNERTIAEAIKSVLSQTYNNIEYIIIDGKSSDNTVLLIQHYKDKIYKIVSEPDQGIYDAMNKGISIATGEVIGILNSDDVYADQFVIENVMKEFTYNNVDIVYGDLEYVKADDLSDVVRTWRSLPYYNTYFEDGHVPPHPSLFLKKAIYDQAGGFNLSLKLAADYEIMLRIFKKYNFKNKYFPQILVKMRMGGATNKNWSNIVKGNLEILKSWKINGLQAPLFLMISRVNKKIAQFKQ